MPGDGVDCRRAEEDQDMNALCEIQRPSIFLFASYRAVMIILSGFAAVIKAMGGSYQWLAEAVMQVIDMDQLPMVQHKWEQVGTLWQVEETNSRTKF
jgi:hypothetical protein